MKPTLRKLAMLSGLGAILIGISVAFANEGTDGIRTALKADDLSIVVAGEAIYKTHCAACHGADLEGQPEWRIRDENGYLPAPPHDASGHTWHHADDQLFEITKYGAAVVIGDDTYKTNMPVYKGVLSDEDIVAVLSYIKNSWPQEQRTWQEQVNGPREDNFKQLEKKSTFLEKLLK